jgi:nucleotide-binding universal stress UspA family protein
MSILERLGLGTHPERVADTLDTDGETFAHFSATSRRNGKAGLPSEQSTIFRNVLVAIHGDEMDDELVKLGCMMARVKKGRVFGVYGVEVPRTLPVDATLPEVTEKAGEALEHAVSLAEGANSEIEPEIVQSRNYGHSLVDEAEAHQCGLIILGIPYRTDRSGRFDPGETVPYVLTHAKCRVWVIRGQQRGS